MVLFGRTRRSRKSELGHNDRGHNGGANMVREKTNLRLLAMAGIALLFGLVATPVTAQVRFVDGFITGTWSEFEPIGANALTTTVVTAGGQTCGPLVAPCAGRPYPGLGVGPR